MTTAPPADVVQWIQQNFAEEERDAALSRVATLLEGFHPLDPRMLRCLCILSKGSLEKFDRAVKEMNTDWRDVILLAEYVDRDGHWVQIRDLRRPLNDPLNDNA